ncbi:Asp-tRNA(Asn)/Glu-tRNA(Gln) amidotransferase subunit GatC [Solemya elarraichensis gill symbiont]|uniref:Aspartyl/glutamyl-tRNA(Asn/Gln) amidotransferase subunit C n=1 Tax=Solemya elarraichensis gill symbiont TaxID=1918949 RepID=A0A1T2L6W5_9GAMM|nr:Asp-tRNA(Asn)/Glu-tRNA(Gln) amidotransferase subunit GatC [Solemya elarraichensis gill symbiont]OOZ40855.1 asparaginyl/glutamyl-tRNA amidotransferase subunit C [Solemya elarraichensis gill symbiont]
MSLDQSDIKKIAHLARLAVDETETAELSDALTSILGLVDTMEQVDTSGVEPMAHPLHMAQRMREDVVTETNLRDKVQKIAPAAENGLYLVPRVIE